MIDDAIICPCFEVQQPIGRFYIARISAKDLIAITHVDVRRIEREEREVETVLGIQRPLSKTRVKEIGAYVNTVDAAFPTSVILAVESFDKDDKNVRNIFYDRATKQLEIRPDGRVAKVLDGQHRIEGLRALIEANEPFECVVTIFVDADIEEQALIFATINKTQTKVNKSLVYDLFELAKNRSPEKTCHNIAILLNRQQGSPFRDKIKVLGTADDAAAETLTQATFVEALLKYISRNAMKDRDFLKRNPSKKLPKDERLAPELFLRSWFREEQDAKIATLVSNYFAAVRQKWPSAWDSPARGLILNKSTGFLALMRFFKDACLHVGIEPLPSQESFFALLDPVKVEDNGFTKEQFIPGSSGQRILYQTIRQQSPIPIPQHL
ncbi:MAG TPA: DGQHR domain-containing protein [Chthoniobacterales bacterium]|jgi:DGQHR domain-containing protein|nr:DGQHR domain-containing protein [Chthoniobacterales bacterium]